MNLTGKAGVYQVSRLPPPTEKGFEGYPASICASVNVVVHGIPSKSIILKAGDIIAIDTTLAKKGYQAMRQEYPVGDIS